MNVEVELPDLGDDAGDQATVSEWHFEEGELVDEDDYLVEVVAGGETLDIRAPANGMLVERSVEEGDLVRVGDVLGIIDVRDDMGLDSDDEE